MLGFDQGGLLTEAIQKNPHAVLLMDEIEKAHPDLFNILLQVMDHASLTDNNGKKADFRNVILIMTCNVGARDMSVKPIGFGEPSPRQPRQAVEKVFLAGIQEPPRRHHPFQCPVRRQPWEKLSTSSSPSLRNAWQAKNVALKVSDKARKHLSPKTALIPFSGPDPWGAISRPSISDVVASEILFGTLKKGGQINIHLDKDKLTFEVFCLIQLLDFTRDILFPI